MNKTPYTITSEKDGRASTKEFEVEVSSDAFDLARTATLKKIAATAELPGFRKGKAPEALVQKEVGEMSILEKAANELINEVTFSVLSEKQLRFIGQPSISITTLAPKNPLRFKMSVSVVPEITLPDYKHIAMERNRKTEPEPEVTDKELTESLEQIRKILARQSGTEKTPPELTDQAVKKLGNFSTVVDFTAKLKQDLLSDKKSREREKKLLEIIEQIISKTPVDVPEALVEHELDRMESEFGDDVKRMGTTLEKYLLQIKKTREEVRNGWQDNAKKRATFELLLPLIARAEKIVVPSEDIERETKHLLDHHKDADKESAKLYVERMLVRQKVLSFLEAQK